MDMSKLKFRPYDKEKDERHQPGIVLRTINDWGEERIVLVGDVNPWMGECDCCAYIEERHIKQIAHITIIK